ncbi:CDP-alcohol phosphatidyltransferase family protein [Capnocytophaga sp. oral taxon 338]|uniref:CDP-alcohol phosphatidyltransferase family protein n=1 Tax=Capnocytophaga sp. oral taxon 338 TaxID=710239 RepID=UPI000202D147|nr:CDP-alcohol phosphatidyltransferase family protein [Capnocytophaga sp. oral taxon 338]EGD34489.1 CDP-alcohol phosphatidyltransferase [Capnocytophaga sp. oral taxon 338 str. F0234]
MISVYKLKPKFQQLLHPLLVWLYKRKVTANQITIVAIMFSLGIGILFWEASVIPLFYLVLPIGLLIRMVLNALDGMMAREFGQTTRLGEILNEVGDVLSDVFISFPLLKYHPKSLYLVVTFIVLSVLNEYAGIMGKVLGGQRRYEGPMGKSDRALLMGIYGLLAYLGVEIHAYSQVIFAIVIVLLLVSTFIRLKKGFYGTP